MDGDGLAREEHARFLKHSDATGTTVLQLGGGDAKTLGDAARLAADFGYARILNCGVTVSTKSGHSEAVSGRVGFVSV